MHLKATANHTKHGERQFDSLLTRVSAQFSSLLKMYTEIVIRHINHLNTFPRQEESLLLLRKFEKAAERKHCCFTSFLKSNAFLNIQTDYSNKYK